MSLENISGIGQKTEILLNKLGIIIEADLITYYPFKYNVICKSNIDDLIQDDSIMIDGVIETIPSVFYFGKKKDKMNFKINVGNYILNAVIYNRGFLKSKLKIGTIVSLYGKYDKSHNLIVASDIKFEKIPLIPVIEPIYHSNYYISSSKIHKYIMEVLKKDFDVIDLIPNEFIDKYNFISKKDAIRIVHNPDNKKNLE